MIKSLTIIRKLCHNSQTVKVKQNIESDNLNYFDYYVIHSKDIIACWGNTQFQINGSFQNKGLFSKTWNYVALHNVQIKTLSNC